MGKLIVLVSDLHCGSTVGLLAPGFENFEGNEVRQNDFQKWLWDNWTELWEDLIPKRVGKDPYVLIVNGDVVEGMHHRSKEIISSEEADHVEAAYQVMSPALKHPSKLFITEGTESHTKNMEHAIGRHLGAEPDPETGRSVWRFLPIVVHGTGCIFRHHINASTRPWTEAYQLAAHMNMERINAVRGGHPILPKVFGRAHRHNFGLFKDVGGLNCVTGPWQGETRYVRKIVPGALPVPTCIVLDWRETEYGGLPDTKEYIFMPEPRSYYVLS